MLSSFQQSLLEDMEPGVWYSIYPSGFRQFPDWFYRQQTQPKVTLRAMVDAQAIVRKRFDAEGGWSFPIYQRPST